MNVLNVDRLCKKYPDFELKNVSFSLETGKITGFIGRNGAGKTTTLKSLFNYVHPDSGEVSFFGKKFIGNELEIKQKIGFVSGGINYYSKKKIEVITDITRRFYEKWDDKAYQQYMKMFKINEKKTPSELSEGMKVKYSLVLALSHNAELLILDEPTSGLDPVSRDDLLDVFLNLCDKGITILFSTHITSDLDKCADNIIYIKNGQIIADSNMKDFIESYKVAEFMPGMIADEIKPKLIGLKRTKEGNSALIKTDQLSGINGVIKDTDLEAIMVHMEKEEE